MIEPLVATANRLEVLPPPAAELETAGRQFAATLDGERRPLLRLAGFHNFLGVESVAQLERVAGRIVVARDRADRIECLIAALGVRCRRGRFDYRTAASAVPGTFHSGSLVPRDDASADAALIYFGADDEFLGLAERLDVERRHEQLGLLLGYPRCCVERYCRGGAGADRTADSIDDPGPYPRAMNPLLATLFRLPLLFHFPCSPRCEPSRALLESRARWLVARAPAARRLLDAGAGIALYGPAIGMMLATGYRRLGDRLWEIDRVISEPAAGSPLAAGGPPLRLRLRGSHRFRLDGVEIGGPDSFAALFE